MWQEILDNDVLRIGLAGTLLLLGIIVAHSGMWLLFRGKSVLEGVRARKQLGLPRARHLRTRVGKDGRVVHENGASYISDDDTDG